MLDINGGQLREGGMAMLLCEVVAIEGSVVRVRIMNSELEILVGSKHDEVLGGQVADSELTAFEEPTKTEWTASAALACGDKVLREEDDGVKLRTIE